MGNYGVKFGVDDDISAKEMAIDFFMRFKDAIVFQKLRNSKEFLNGIELKRKLDPNSHVKHASNWLEDQEWVLDMLKRAGLIEEFKTNIGRFGYGDDRGYRLTQAAKVLVSEFKDNNRIEAAVAQILMFGHRLHA